MQGFYAWYVRIGYYERQHPVRYGAGAAAVMVAVLWPLFWRMNAPLHESATHDLLAAATYSVGFCGLNALLSRRPRRQARFERWAARHPDPSSFPSTAPAEPISEVVPHGFTARAAWVGRTLLVAFGIMWFLGLIASSIEGFHGGGDGVVELALLPFALAGAVLLRLYWPPVRNWKSRA